MNNNELLKQLIGEKLSNGEIISTARLVEDRYALLVNENYVFALSAMSQTSKQDILNCKTLVTMREIK